MAVTRLETNLRQPFDGGASFGETGAYELIEGVAHFAVDPHHLGNSVITDIGLAPRNQGGRVEFSAGFRILQPADPAKGSRRMLFDVVNRGRMRSLYHFNSAPDLPSDAPVDAGNGFLMRDGYTLAWCGWQHDVPAQPGMLRIQVPEARENGTAVSGRIAVTFQPNEAATESLLSDRGHVPYSAADLNEESAQLTVQDHEWDEPATIPRSQWSFARMDGGAPRPDANHVYFPAGFQPGKIYRCVYTTATAPVVGLGMLAVRDFVSHLRNADGAEDNPCAGRLDHAHAFGASQSGRFLRHMVYLGLNLDERDRTVFDGIIAHIAGGRRGEFNQRFGQPSNLNELSTGSLFPFADIGQTDPETGRTDGLLSRLAGRDKLPKLFLTNTSSEYWSGHAALTHTDVSGTRDIAPSDNVRIYHFSGTNHNPGELPLTDTQGATGMRGIHATNWVDYRPLLRSALTRLDRWVTEGTPPAPSSHPRLDDGTAVPPESVAGVYGAVPQMPFPKHIRRLAQLDFGPPPSGFPSRFNEGYTAKLPPDVGGAYPSLVSSVDTDGNELAGIRLPAVAVPLATVLGWNLRHPSTGGEGQTHKTMGSTVAFAATRAEREASGDPRPSVEERYPSKEAYLDRVESCALELVRAGFLLEEDVNTVTGQAAERYDLPQSKASAAATA